MRSKDPSTQVGACIVNEDKRIVGIGYNGFPKGCSDDDLPWARTASTKYDTKYMVNNDYTSVYVIVYTVITPIIVIVTSTFVMQN
jgi:deoxycytidylate deaminase